MQNNIEFKNLSDFLLFLDNFRLVEQGILEEGKIINSMQELEGIE